ncbi:MAG: hypothetical protein A2297_01980 [Elusimicrobia bacterium RIFOXYB2_FULL_48_7]|nr:MAG: hypothetical protein A2297_01980 [Elusimicrobia bacterium RIFOXYB2_FULL_48_7]
MPHYIIDGYNVVKQLPELMDRKLQEGREELIKILKFTRPQGSMRNKVTIVFDGNEDGFFTTTAQVKGHNIAVTFSQGESADDRIRYIVKRDPAPRDIIVVTDDRDLRSSVKIHGAKVMYVKEFIKPRITPHPDNKRKIALSSQEESEITEELKGLWK